MFWALFIKWPFLGRSRKWFFFWCGFHATCFLGLPFKSCRLLWTTIITSLRDVNSYLMFLNALTTMSHLLVEGSMGFLQPRWVRLKFRVFLLLGLVLWRDLLWLIFVWLVKRLRDPSSFLRLHNIYSAAEDTSLSLSFWDFYLGCDVSPVAHMGRLHNFYTYVQWR